MSMPVTRSSCGRPVAVRSLYGAARAARPVQMQRQSRRLQLLCRAADVPVTFQIQKEVSFGEELRLVGGQAQLGNWQPDAGLKLKWGDGHVWTGQVALPPGTEVEFKCVRYSKSNVSWEDGRNRKLKVSGNGGGEGVQLKLRWSQTDQTEAREGGGGVDTSSYQAISTQEDEGGYTSDDSSGRQWLGRDIHFMRSNEHSRERSGKWDTSGLDGAALAIVKGDQEAPNWLSKLRVAKNVLVQEPPPRSPDISALAHAYVYLAWVASGAVPCVEGGGHYRPNHHAEIARLIFRSLEFVIGDGTTAAVPKFLGRKLQTKIPAFTSEFRVSTPLTSIRDLAHRSDIPHDLKQEIKHTLQNKLHRNAGPEDLVASELMYQRLINEKDRYPESFLTAFRHFLAELRDFFNANALDDLLEGVKSGVDDTNVGVITRFLVTKKKVDNPSASLNDLMECAHSLTTLRAVLASGLNSGLRNDAPDHALEMRQRWRLAEIRCEEFFFVLVSRVINVIESKGASGFLSRAPDTEWAQPLGCLVLALRNMGLSGWEWGECAALDQEVTAWHKDGRLTEREQALRLKATLERVQRLTELYTDSLLGLFVEPSNTLGRALGVPPHAMSVFTESEVRESVVFQLSRLCTILLKAARAAAGAGVWDAVVAGSASGTLTAVDRIDPAWLLSLSHDVVLLVRSADGDEELAAAGTHLRGVVLLQELPHLSHLGVRARQERVPFVCVDDREFADANLIPLVGQQVTLTVSQERTAVEAGGASSGAATSGTAKAAGGNGNGGANGNGSAPRALSVSRVSAPTLLDAARTTAELCGAKAAACARMLQIAQSSSGDAAFRAPRGVSLPYGSLGLAVEAAGPRVKGQFTDLLRSLNELAPAQLSDACARLQDLVRGLALPASITAQLQQSFDSKARLICRSSANVEDLAGLSGAGLYDSIPNVPAADEQALRDAVTRVWASLYTRRAVLSRRAASVAQSDAEMAVLIQELIEPDYCFVIHTASPFGDDPGTAYVELAVGLGETLASAKRGSPWRLTIRKADGAVSTLAFANLSAALYTRTPSSSGIGSRGGSATATRTELQLVSKTLDYSKIELSTNSELREALGRRLGAIALLLEREFGSAQDVEGCVKGADIYIVQSRPQP